MINLIPPSARKKVLTEYWVRVSTIWLLIFGVACLIVSLILLPVYVLINSQINVYASSADEASSKIMEFDTLASTITAANAKAQKLFTLNQTYQKPYRPFSIWMHNMIIYKMLLLRMKCMVNDFFH